MLHIFLFAKYGNLTLMIEIIPAQYLRNSNPAAPHTVDSLQKVFSFSASLKPVCQNDDY